MTLLGASCSSEGAPVTPPEQEEELSTVKSAVSSLRAACLVAEETLWQQADRCKDAMGGVEIPGFECESGSIPGNEGTVYGDEDDGVFCDAPNVLNGKCDPGSKFRVLRRGINPVSGAPDGIYIVAHCRKQGNGPNQFGDIAMIAHNKNTGATCFFQALGTLSGSVIAPRISTQNNPAASNYYPWISPAGLSSNPDRRGVPHLTVHVHGHGHGHVDGFRGRGRVSWTWTGFVDVDGFRGRARLRCRG
ncbi:MAG: hypothetical protein MUF64_04855 [Polyangiaceae bacterium]|jgi:hypothetical protein|nr:hypothetical protein [Polyangiaceae bacterium]